MSVIVHPQYLVDAAGERKVMLSVAEFEALMQELEDYTDAARLAHLRATSTPADFMELDEFEAELKAEGLL